MHMGGQAPKSRTGPRHWVSDRLQSAARRSPLSLKLTLRNLLHLLREDVDLHPLRHAAGNRLGVEIFLAVVDARRDGNVASLIDLAGDIDQGAALRLVEELRTRRDAEA